MRCTCCNRLLSDYESTLRHAVTREFLDTCNKCLEDLDIPSTGRPDLNKFVGESDTDFLDFDNNLEEDDGEEAGI